MSPPLSMKPHWFEHHTAYTMAKYGMSMCTLGHAAEFKRHGIAVNSLWPRTAINTAALQMIPGVDTEQVPHARDPGRRRLPDPDQRRRDDERQLLHRRRAAGASTA